MARLHRRRPRHLAEPQRAVRSHEIVEGAEELQEIIERPLLPCMARGKPTQVGRALTNREVHPLDERGVELRRALGLLKRIGKSPLRTHDQFRSHAHDSVVLDLLDDLGEHAPEAEHVANRGRVELEAVGRYQRGSPTAACISDASDESSGVPIRAPPNESRRPEPGPDVDAREHPRLLLAALNERVQLVELKIDKVVPAQVPRVEAASDCRGQLQPASNRVSGEALETRNGGLVDALDVQGRDAVEASPFLRFALAGDPSPDRCERSGDNYPDTGGDQRWGCARSVTGDDGSTGAGSGQQEFPPEDRDAQDRGPSPRVQSSTASAPCAHAPASPKATRRTAGGSRPRAAPCARSRSGSRPSSPLPKSRGARACAPG